MVVKEAPNNAESRPSEGEVRVKPNSLRITRGSILIHVAAGLAVLDAHATEIRIVSGRVCRRRLGADLLHQPFIQLLRDGVGYFALDGEDIV